MKYVTRLKVGDTEFKYIDGIFGPYFEYDAEIDIYDTDDSSTETVYIDSFLGDKYDKDDQYKVVEFVENLNIKGLYFVTYAGMISSLNISRYTIEEIRVDMEISYHHTERLSMREKSMIEDNEISALKFRNYANGYINPLRKDVKVDSPMNVNLAGWLINDADISDFGENMTSFGVITKSGCKRWYTLSEYGRTLVAKMRLLK